MKRRNMIKKTSIDIKTDVMFQIINKIKNRLILKRSIPGHRPVKKIKLLKCFQSLYGDIDLF